MHLPLREHVRLGGADSKHFKNFFADHSLLMTKGDNDCPSLPPDNNEEDDNDHKPTKVCAMRYIPYNPKSDLYDSDDEYPESSVLQKRR